MKSKKQDREFSGGPVVHIFTAEGIGLIPGQGTKIPQTQMAKQKHFLNEKTKQMNKHNKTETESQIQRTNRWLPKGRGWVEQRNR